MRTSATAAPVLARAARPRAATPVFVDGGRRARATRALGRLVAVGLLAWIALTAVALVGSPWADGLRLRSDQTVAHPLPDPDASSSHDGTEGGAPLFTGPVPRREAAPAAPPGSALLGPLATDDTTGTAPDDTTDDSSADAGTGGDPSTGPVAAAR